MKFDIFPDIKFRPEFKDFENEPYFQMVLFLKHGTPDLRKVYINNEASNILKYKAFQDFVKLLAKNDCGKLIPVKGMWLLNGLFSEYAGIRQMVDVDLLFNKREFRKIPAFLKKNPYIYQQSKGSMFIRSYLAEEISVVFNSVLIEMHSKITLVSFAGLIDEIFKRSTEIENHDKMNLLSPEIEYGAVLMLLHDYSRADFCDLTCKRLLEFYIVLKNCDLNKIIEITNKFGFSNMLNCHLFLLYTIIENPFFNRNVFSIHEAFGNIKKSQKNLGFVVEKGSKLQKAVYGKNWKRLKLRNLLAKIFKMVRFP